MSGSATEGEAGAGEGRSGSALAAAHAAVIENLPDGLIIADSRSQMVYWNLAARKLYGFSSSEQANRSLHSLPEIFELSTLDGSVLTSADWPIPRLLRGELLGTMRYRIRRRRTDWSRLFQCTGARVRFGRDSAVAFLMTTDVTAQRSDEEARMQLAAIVSSSEDAIVGVALDGTIRCWNRGAEKLFGHPCHEVLGRPLAQIAGSPGDGEAFRPVSLAPRVDRFDAVRIRKDGRPIDLSVTISPILDQDGHVIGESRIARDITARRRGERELLRLNRLYGALSQANQAIIRRPERAELFDRICRALVEQAGFAMAWIGWEDPATHRLEPAAFSGEGGAYLETVRIYSDQRPEGRGPSGAAFRSGNPSVCNDLMANQDAAPWHDACNRYGFRASASFPIALAGQVRGVLSVYASETQAFRDREVELLAEAAADLSFALDNEARDAQGRLAAAAALREQAFSSTLLESMPGIFYFFDENGRFLRWNSNFMAVTGYRAEEIGRMHPLEFFAEAEKELVRERIQEVFAKGESQLEAKILAKDGGSIPYFLTGRRIVIDGIPGMLGMGVDITDRKRAELRVLELNEELEHRVVDRTAELQAANNELEAFSYSVSHDLRAPLRAVNGFADIVLQDYGAQLPEEGRRLLERIRGRGLRMGELIDDLLSFSKLGRLPMSRREIDVDRLVGAVLLELTPSHEGRPIEFRIEPLGRCHGDRTLLRQVWVNLLGNAIKYTRGRDPAIIEVSHTAGQNEDVYRVQDNGAGFDMRFAQKLFAVFQRLHLADEFEGTGVGLAIVKRVVERHGGRVWAEGAEQRGATFHFAIPRPVSDAPAATP